PPTTTIPPPSTGSASSTFFRSPSSPPPPISISSTSLPAGNPTTLTFSARFSSSTSSGILFSLPDSSFAPEPLSLPGSVTSPLRWWPSSLPLAFPMATISSHSAPTPARPAGAISSGPCPICSWLFSPPPGSVPLRVPFTNPIPASPISSSRIFFPPAFPSWSFSWAAASPRNNSSSPGWPSPPRSSVPPSALSSPTENNNAPPRNSTPPNSLSTVLNRSLPPRFAGAPILSASTSSPTGLTSTSTRVSLVLLDTPVKKLSAKLPPK